MSGKKAKQAPKQVLRLPDLDQERRPEYSSIVGVETVAPIPDQ